MFLNVPKKLLYGVACAVNKWTVKLFLVGKYMKKSGEKGKKESGQASESYLAKLAWSCVCTLCLKASSACCMPIFVKVWCAFFSSYGTFSVKVSVMKKHLILSAVIMQTISQIKCIFQSKLSPMSTCFLCLIISFLTSVHKLGGTKHSVHRQLHLSCFHFAKLDLSSWDVCSFISVSFFKNCKWELQVDTYLN